jgi:hypothetical protein
VSTEWEVRLQQLERANLERWSEAGARFRRFLADLATAGPRLEVLAPRMARAAHEQGILLYQRLSAAGARYILEATRLNATYRDGALGAIRPPEGPSFSRATPLPPVPALADPTSLAGWLQLLSVWMTQQQADSAHLYSTLRASAGDSGYATPDRLLFQRRTLGWVVGLAELNSGLLAEILSATGAYLDAVSEPLAAGLAPPPVILEVAGRPGGTAVAWLLIENGHHSPASVICLADPVGEFGLRAEPHSLRLEAGESRRVGVHVEFPPFPPAGAAPAGWITVRGHGESDLVAEVLARVDDLAPVAGG